MQCRTVSKLCFVLLQTTQEAARARKTCRGKHETVCFALLRFLNALQQNRSQSRLPYLFYDKESVKFPTLYFNFFNKSESGLYQNCILKTGEGIEFILKAVLIGFICLTEIHK